MPIHSGSRVEFFAAALKEMQDQPKSIRAKFRYIRWVIESEGLHRVPSHYKKSLKRDGLWEIRVDGENTTARALYLKLVGGRIIILRVFTKKSPKTPPSEIKLALKRAKEVRNA